MDTKRKGPMSKFVVRASMLEAWASAIICVVFCWFDKDISSLTAVVTVSWAGYEIVKSAYIWMAKNEHIEEIKSRHKDDTTADKEIREYIDQKSNEIDSEC